MDQSECVTTMSYSFIFMNVCKFNKKKKYFGIFKFEFIARIGGVDSNSDSTRKE